MEPTTKQALFKAEHTASNVIALCDDMLEAEREMATTVQRCLHRIDRDRKKCAVCAVEMNTALETARLSLPKEQRKAA